VAGAVSGLTAMVRILLLCILLRQHLHRDRGRERDTRGQSTGRNQAAAASSAAGTRVYLGL
jgi:hypothetical protein